MNDFWQYRYRGALRIAFSPFTILAMSALGSMAVAATIRLALTY